jgi:hypothetical protein
MILNLLIGREWWWRNEPLWGASRLPRGLLAGNRFFSLTSKPLHSIILILEKESPTFCRGLSPESTFLEQHHILFPPSSLGIYGKTAEPNNFFTLA